MIIYFPLLENLLFYVIHNNLAQWNFQTLFWFPVENFSCAKSEILLGRRFPAKSKEHCVKFPSRSSEISWLLNEDGEKC